MRTIVSGVGIFGRFLSQSRFVSTSLGASERNSLQSNDCKMSRTTPASSFRRPPRGANADFQHLMEHESERASEPRAGGEGRSSRQLRAMTAQPQMDWTGRSQSRPEKRPGACCAEPVVQDQPPAHIATNQAMVTRGIQPQCQLSVHECAVARFQRWLLGESASTQSRIARRKLSGVSTWGK